MNVILHETMNPKEEKEMAKRIAEIHADYILQFLGNLSCPPEQKMQIIENIKKESRRQDSPSE